MSTFTPVLCPVCCAEGLKRPNGCCVKCGRAAGTNKFAGVSICAKCRPHTGHCAICNLPVDRELSPRDKPLAERALVVLLNAKTVGG
ncbi:MAG: hypothetical protein PHT12_04160 [Patescibacteria group bacterium]|nr:hypothetical protein [Patescibacteria group bacterium]